MPMADEAKEPTCLHHTFAHAKALATLVCAQNVPTVTKNTLPCEKNYGIRAYQNGKLILFSNGKFRATFSACHAMLLGDFASNGGGSMNLLYHKNCGIICAATSAEYVPSEPMNQQYLRNADEVPCMTVQFVLDGEMACKDKDVSLSGEGESISATAKNWQAKYSFTEDGLNVELNCKNGTYNFPVVCSKHKTAVLAEDGHTLTIDGKLTLRSSERILTDTQKRVFNQVGGLLYLPISIDVKGSATLSLTIAE